MSTRLLIVNAQGTHLHPVKFIVKLYLPLLYIDIKSSLCYVFVYKSYLDIFLDVTYSVFCVNNIYLFHPCSVYYL